MKMKNLKKSLSFIFCAMLIVAMALCTTACNDETKEPQTTKAPQTTEAPKTTNEPMTTEAPQGLEQLGEGSTVFEFCVVDFDGNEKKYEIHTDKKMVGEALLELNLIEGEPGAYGLYVKTVNGITADYDKDKAYWAFYVNDSYAMSGVDSTEIKEGEVYSFKVEKA